MKGNIRFQCPVNFQSKITTEVSSLNKVNETAKLEIELSN